MNNTWTTIFSALAVALLNASAHALVIDITETEDTQYLMVSGDFSDDTVSASKGRNLNQDSVNLLNTFNVAGRGKAVAILVSSEGGSREAALEFSRTVNLIAKSNFEKRGRPMVLGLVGNCHSACTFFAAAMTKSHNREHLRIYTPQETQFRFHGPVNFDNGNPLPRVEFEYHLSTGIWQYLDSGVDPQWLHKNKSMFRTREGKVFEAKALCRQNSRIVPQDACVRNYDDLEDKVLRLSQGKNSSSNPFRKILELFRGN